MSDLPLRRGPRIGIAKSSVLKHLRQPLGIDGLEPVGLTETRGQCNIGLRGGERASFDPRPIGKSRPSNWEAGILAAGRRAQDSYPSG